MNKKSYINIEKNNISSISEKIEKPIIYCSEDYLIPKQYKGEGVKIALLDSGCPKHKDIKIEGEKINFCDTSDDVYDYMGHSTLISGVIKAVNGKAVTGLAPKSQIYYAKVMKKKEICNHNAIVAAVLWAIIKKVDIIGICMGSDYDYTVLHDAIKKAYRNKITVIAASGYPTENNQNISFPAQYVEAMSVGYLTKNKKYNDVIRKQSNIIAQNKKYTTTYLNNKYVKAGGSSMSSAIVIAVAALLIEQKKKNATSVTPSIIYKELIEIFK